MDVDGAGDVAVAVTEEEGDFIDALARQEPTARVGVAVGADKAFRPFEWIVSDFGLVDAIESGLVKVPRIPTNDDSEPLERIGRAQLGPCSGGEAIGT